MNTMNEQALLERTRDAYSFDRYGATAWANAIRLLDAEGYTEDEIEWILCSKYMRWAADHFGVRSHAELDDVIETLNGTEIILYGNKWSRIEIEQD